MSLPYTANRAENLTPPTNNPRDEAAQSKLDSLAAAIERIGMAGVAPVLLRAFKPAAWAGSQMLWVLQPFMGPSMKDPYAGVSGLAHFFESEANVEALIERLDTPRKSQQEGGK